MNVCAYCRVSTDRDDQANSFENQQQYFEKYIRQHPEWNLINIYADEGITGTSTAKRKNFNRMIEDARNKKFDLILTKEVSRFARNTVDTLQYTRELKNIDVRVIFLIDNIDTFDTDGEFRLTIMASIAQEESRKTSERVKWGIAQQMKRGFVYSPSLLGYDVSKGTIKINPAEAETVKTIFHKFAYENQSAHSIAKELIHNGVKPVKKMKTWTSTAILRILRNEKYVGDLIQRKTYVKNFLDHKCVTNTDLSTMFFLENHHEAIIDRDTWNIVQERLNERNKDIPERNDIKKENDSRFKASNKYWCSGKIKCGLCGKNFSIKSKRLSDDSPFYGWKCINRIKFGTKKIDGLGNIIGCNNDQINQKALERCVEYAYSVLIQDQASVIASIKDELDVCGALTNTGEDNTQTLIKHRDKLEAKREKVIEMFVDGLITREELTTMKNKYTSEISMITKKIEKYSNFSDKDLIEKRIKSIEKRIEEIILSEEYKNDTLYEQIIDYIVAYPSKLEIHFNNIPTPIIVNYKTYGRGENYTTECTHEFA